MLVPWGEEVSMEVANMEEANTAAMTAAISLA